MKMAIRGALLSVSLVFAVGVNAQPAMWTTVTEVSHSFEACKALTEKSLIAEGFGNLRDFGNGTFGSSRDTSASVGCVHGRNATVLFVVSAGPDGGNAMVKLLRRMGAAVPAFLTPAASRGGICGNLAGVWSSGGGATSIEQDGDTLRFKNDSGMTSPGQCTSAFEVIASDWDGGLRGALNADRTYIQWANGTHWNRPSSSADAPSIDPSNFLGAWQRGGRTAQVQRDGRGLVCINEFGGPDPLRDGRSAHHPRARLGRRPARSSQLGPFTHRLEERHFVVPLTATSTP
jgi:hypothetical protein